MPQSRVTVLAFLLAATVGLAGCLSTPEAESTETPAESASVPEADASPAAAAPEGDAPPAEPSVDEPITKRLELEGHTGDTICHPGGVGSTYCIASPTRPAGPYPSLHFPMEGTLIGGTATLAWTAESPFTETLRFHVADTESCGDGCYSWTRDVEVRGTSPLTIEIPADFGEFALGVRGTSREATMGTGYEFGQDFVIDLVYSFLPPAPIAPGEADASSG